MGEQKDCQLKLITMVEFSKKTLLDRWLKNRLVDRQNGIVFVEHTAHYFNTIQDFIEANDRPRETPVIYYQAFPEESATEFIEVLSHELTSKFGNRQFDSTQSLAEITATVGLKAVIIDRSYLHPLDSLYEILDRLASCDVATILIGSYCKMEIAKVLEYPNIDRWQKLVLDEYCEIVHRQS